MQLTVILFAALLAAYFLFAAFLPKLRIRWGNMTSITFYPPPVTKKHYRKSLMGGLSCFGFGLFLAGFPTLHFGSSVPLIPMTAISLFATGLILGILGQARDKALEGQGWKRYKSEKHED